MENLPLSTLLDKYDVTRPPMAPLRLILALGLFVGSASGYAFPRRPAPLSMTASESERLNRRSLLSNAAALGAAAVTTAAAATTGPALAAEGSAKVVDASAIEVTDGGAKFVTVKEGQCPASDFTGVLGSCRPSPGKFIIIDYTAFLPNGQVFDTTEKKGGKPLAFQLGSRQVIPGIEEVVQYMKPGQEVQALIPAKLAYGSKGVCPAEGECLIPPDTNLKYFIKLIRVTSAAG